jgi:low temperature requirement protein LtrA
VARTRGRSAAPALDEASGVTTLELFFDLVFVFAVTQLTTVVRHGHGVGDLVRPALILFVLWWMYDGFAWLTNNVSTASTSRRLLLLLGMAGFLVVAVAVPNAFGNDGVIFGVAYLALVLIHFGMFTLAQSSLSARAIWSIAPFNLGCALLVLAAGWFTGAADYVLWSCAAGVLVASMLRRAETGFELRPAHFAERHGLIVIIALGESVVGIGVGAEHRLHDAQVTLTALLGLALAAVLWWLFFDHDDEEGAESLAGMSSHGRAQQALYAYSLGVLLLVAGIVAVAAGLETAVAHPAGHLSTWAAWILASGTAIYLLALGLFRRLLHLPRAWLRPVVAVPALACALIGMFVSGPVEIAVLAVVLGLSIAFDRTHRGFTAAIHT